jgi:hypothetical protein
VIFAPRVVRARLNCIDHLLRQFDFKEIERPEIVLPERERRPP